MSDNNQSPAKTSTLLNGKLVLRLNISFIIGFLAYLALFAQIFWAEGQPLYVLIVATAAMNLGAFIGFLYSTYGPEEKKFSQMFVAVNGVLSGAMATDLFQKDHSIIIKSLEHITIGCGLDVDYAGLVFVVIITCAPVGFFWLYFNRKLVLNPEMHIASKTIEEANQVMNQKPLQIITEPDMEKPVADPEVKAAAKLITEDKDAIKSESAGVLANLGRSFYELGRYADAIPPLLKALKIRPNQSDTLLTTASAMINAGKSVEAIEVLEKLTSLPSVPALAWKLLGYAYLFYPDDKPDKQQKLEQSIEASRKYIASEPGDYGSKLNLACAYGQLGPQYADATKEVVSIITEILKNAPGYKQRIKELVQPGQDFSGWNNVNEFMQLLS